MPLSSLLYCTDKRQLRAQFIFNRREAADKAEKLQFRLFSPPKPCSLLKEMNLNNSHLLDSGVKEICEGLKNPVCELKILKVSYDQTNIAEALSSVLGMSVDQYLPIGEVKQTTLYKIKLQLLLFVIAIENMLGYLFLKSPAAEEACEYLTGVLGKSPLLLKELDLSEDKLGDLDWEKLSALLMDSHSKLEKIMLNNCELTEKSCSVLATVLSSKTILKEMNLNNSHLLDSGVKEICEGLKNPVCELKILKVSYDQTNIAEALSSVLGMSVDQYLPIGEVKQTTLYKIKLQLLLFVIAIENMLGYLFLKSPAAEEACEYLTGVLGKSPLLLKELDLSEDKLGDLDWEKLSALLMDSHSKLEKIMLNNCELTEKSCSVLATVLSSKTILKEMNLNNSHLLDSGVKEICEGLKNPVCELKILKFLKSPAAEEACEYLTGVLGKSPLLLKELDLSEDKLGDLDWEKLSALLMDSHSKLEKIMLNNCELTEKSCSVLATVLSSKTILKEMNLNNSHLLDSGVKEICEGLKNPVCELKILK
ncbi:ribonuclease inhibitor-like [Carassius auratus]|uniref:Ribonuclease inhibitor-like n=1 Tax=Carassius auratus TaxID=7957 RepID=A0A6P6NGV1_CARAU|nr:ribonuclease inhibitor-like [Carassius auratus]